MEQKNINACNKIKIIIWIFLIVILALNNLCQAANFRNEILMINSTYNKELIRQFQHFEKNQSWQLSNFFLEDIEKNNLDIDKLKKTISQTKPKLIVLADSEAVSFYRSYVEKLGDNIPLMILNTKNVDKKIQFFTKAFGVRYEVSIAIAASHLKYHLNDNNLKNLGVVYRNDMQTLIDLNKKHLFEFEKINLTSFVVDNNAGIDEIKNAYLKLLRDKNIDGVWIVSDEKLYRPGVVYEINNLLLEERNISVLADSDMICGTEMNISTFMVKTDQYGLGIQISNYFNEMFSVKNDKSFEIFFGVDNKVTFPFSSKKYINDTISSNNKISYDKEKLVEINRIIRTH